MRKSRFRNEQIVFVLKQAEAGVPVQELLRKYNISQATFCQGRVRGDVCQPLNPAAA